MHSLHPYDIYSRVGFKGDEQVNQQGLLILRADIDRVWKVARFGHEVPPEKFQLGGMLLEILERLTEIAKRRQPVALDIETTGHLNNFSQLRTVGLGLSESEALCVPFLLADQSQVWTLPEQTRLQHALEQVFSNCPLLLQNALFDVVFLKRQDWQISMKSVQHDIMLLHHAICPELPHDLGFINSVYGRIPYWKNPDWTNDEQVWQYNCRDTVVLFHCLPGLLEDLKQRKCEPVYFNEAIPMLYPVSNMMLNGVMLDQEALAEVSAKFSQEKQREESIIRDLIVLPEWFSFTSDEHLRKLFYGWNMPKWTAAVKTLKAWDTINPKPKKPGTKVHQKTLQSAELLAMEALYKPLGFCPRATGKTGLPSVNQQELLRLQRAAQTRLERMAVCPEERYAAQRLFDVLKHYYKYAEFEKLLSTYTRFSISPKGLIYPSYLLHGTATRRLASRDPNIQNQPRKGDGFRQIYISRPGYTFVSADYKNLEVYVLAYVTGDEKLIQTLRASDLHDENTYILFGLRKGQAQFKAGRRAAKIFMFGSISYDGSDNEIHEKISLEVPELGLSLIRLKQAKQAWYKEHQPVLDWKERVKEHARLTRDTYIFNGAVRHLTGSDRDILKQAVNTPIQGGAAIIINQAMLRLEDQMIALGALTVMQVHDQLVYEVPDAVVSQSLPLLRTEMSRVVMINGRACEFPVDIEVGKNLEDLHEYKAT